jgi:hypothetical protein
MTRLWKSIVFFAIANMIALTAAQANAQDAIAVKRASEVLAFTSKCIETGAVSALSDKETMTLAIAILGSGAVFNEAGRMASLAAAKDAATRAAIDPTFCTATWNMIETLAQIVRMRMPNVEEFVRRTAR